jgi:type 1 glutamine amidotransferase
LNFRKFGLVKGGNVPFEIIHPAKTTSGNNLVVLKGGSGMSKSYAQQVEVNNLNVKAGKLHFLSGVGGWAYPCCGENKNENLPVAKVTVKFAEGASEEFILKNAVEFADYNGVHEVPGSKFVPEIVRGGQVRTFSRALKNKSPIQKITLESFNNAVAPTFVAITAETGEGAAVEHADASANAAIQNDGSTGAKAAPVFKWGEGIKVLLVGGGSSHDFNKWFRDADTAILSEGGLAATNYTDQPAAIAGALKDIDVLYQSSNQKMDDKDLRKAIVDFADAGNGLILVHAGLWYNWPDWTDYNRVLAGGGAKGHDKFGEFEVNVDLPDHPVMKGVPATFKITDELYYSKFEEQGTPVQVLATAKNTTTGKTFPSVWIVKHPKARIVAIALGHDGKAHDLPAYRTLLRNALTWAAGK